MAIKKSILGLSAILASQIFAATVVHAAVPTEITFSNFTDLALTTSIAGLPGRGIAPNIVKPVSYNIVNLACTFYNVTNSCPIEFVDSASGNKVASVYINSNTATLTQAPTFYGKYADLYEVLGWETSPITAITISKKGSVRDSDNA